MSKRWKNILTVSLYILLTLSAGGYFYAASTLHAAKKAGEKCKEIHVTLLDSALNKFVTKQEVLDLINRYDSHTIGRRIDSVNLYNLEKILNQRSVIKKSQVYISSDGRMSVDILQRKPIIRLETAGGGFYIDDTAYVFPLIQEYTSYVPVVSGHLPIKPDGDWIKKVMELGKYLEANPFWNSQVEQIYFRENGDVVLSLKMSDQDIILGDLTSLSEKFDKLYSFYKCAPSGQGWNKYSEINLKYKKQIVCKRKK